MDAFWSMRPCESVAAHCIGAHSCRQAFSSRPGILPLAGGWSTGLEPFARACRTAGRVGSVVLCMCVGCVVIALVYEKGRWQEVREVGGDMVVGVAAGFGVGALVEGFDRAVAADGLRFVELPVLELAEVNHADPLKRSSVPVRLSRRGPGFPFVESVGVGLLGDAATGHRPVGSKGTVTSVRG